MIRRIFSFVVIVTALVAFMACSDDDSFTTSPTAQLTFSADSVKMDTIFSTVGSRTYDFWVYNRSRAGVRLKSVRLQQGNQTGFRVNVDGSYLDNSLGAIVNDLEIRKGDSIRVFVELTAPENGQDTPMLIQDRLLFKLESGVEQGVVLQGYSWDAIVMHNTTITSDTVIESQRPLLVYGGIKVDSTATLTIRNTTLYFHDGKGIDVYGRLICDSVTMRGDRLDHMFDYLPYDRVSGQWGSDGGVVFHPSSNNNILCRTEIRNAGMAGVMCISDTCDTTSIQVLMEKCVIHNCKGYGLQSANACVSLHDCQISNTELDCIYITGGYVTMNHCTLAQFYPFVGGRGSALRFDNDQPLHGVACDSCIITGYDEDVLTGIRSDTTNSFEYQFSASLLRTPRVETADSVHFTMIRWETPKDSIQGKQHFRLVDEQNLRYDFHLDSLSTAIGLGCYY